MAASRQARSGRFITIGASSTSGGIGKNEASANAATARAQPAWREADNRIIQS